MPEIDDAIPANTTLIGTPFTPAPDMGVSVSPNTANTDGVSGSPTEAALTPEELDLQANVLDIINQWVRDEIHGSPIARHTEAYNHLRQALPGLARNIVKGL